MIDMLAGVIGAGTVALPAAALVTRSVRGLRREARRAGRLALSLDAARYEATHDALTGVFNRGGFLAEAGAVLADAAAPSVVGLVDLDRFKEVNDRYGHGVGDIALVAVARRLAAAAGDGAVVGRLGGDEFAVLLPAGHADGLAPGLAVTVPASPGVAIELTASVGLAHADEPRDLAVLLGRADAAMYRAKASGASAFYEPRRDDHSVVVAGSRPAVRTRELTVDQPCREVRWA